MIRLSSLCLCLTKTNVPTKVWGEQVKSLAIQKFCWYISGMEPEPKMGRPIKGDEQRSARIGIRAEPDDKNRYQRAAKLAEQTLSDWIKTRLDRAAKRELGE